MREAILYLKENRKTYLSLAVFFLILSAVFFLSSLPLRALIYPAVLFLVLFSAGSVFDFIRWRKHHMELSGAIGLDVPVLDMLPVPRTEAEADCMRIIAQLEDRLATAKKVFDEKYEDMTDYYTVWAHQIKTPIAAMRLILQNEDSGLSRKLLTELFRIEQYAEMVMAFLRLDSSSSDYVFSEHDVDGVVRSCVKKFAGEFIGRRLSLDYEPLDIKAVTDEKWFGFVIEQLLSNALKYTKEGGIKIYQASENIICIKDSGIGISRDDLPRIFDKGYTGRNGRADCTGVGSASGLGLYLCRRICENLGIRIWAESEEGCGTTVFLDISQHRVIHE